MPQKPSSSKLIPETRAMVSLGSNLDAISHFLELGQQEIAMMRGEVSRVKTFVSKNCRRGTTPKELSIAVSKIDRSLKRCSDTMRKRINRFQAINLWQIVMLVTCVEAYLQDVLADAAGVDPKIMSESEQKASYEQITAATSLETLANDLRARWARNWVSEGGPTRWLSRLKRMGAKGYPPDLGPRLERFWGIRHVVIHAAGVATPQFVKRHPGVARAVGDRLRANHHDFKRFVEAVQQFLDPTDQYFLARCPSLLSVPKAS